MKKLLLSFVAFVFATVCLAQQQLVATLTHGEEISMFYGSYAFRDAMNAAVDGDVINLSGGNFHATTINKAVSIRGTGTEVETPTIILESFDINISEESTGLTIEGLRIPETMNIKGTLKNVLILKNYLHNVDIQGDANLLKNFKFVNCLIDRCSSNATGYCQFLNCFIKDIWTRDNANLTTEFVSCVISKGHHLGSICYSTLLNCILVNDDTYTWSSLPSTSSAFYCLAVSARGGDAYKDIATGANNQSIQDLSIFTDSDCMKDLTDAAKRTYLGSDGTPVGMYGGPLPFSLTPTYPQITKMNVASKTTADGKLSVDIEVSAAK